MSTKMRGAYGSWKSPLTPDQFAKGNCGRLAEVQPYKDGVFWIEQNIWTGKRELYQYDGRDTLRWADGMSVQNAVHEYGGGSFILLPSASLLFSTVDGVWIQKGRDSTPEKVLDSGGKSTRHADFAVSPDQSFFLAVQEVHPPPSLDGHYPHPENRLISYHFSSQQTTVVQSGSDFYSQPRISPCGRFVSWIHWMHPNMPFDETELRVQEVDCFLNKEKRDLEGGPFVVRVSGVGRQVNVYGSEWKEGEEGVLNYVSDESGVWNVYELKMNSPGEKPRNILPADEEIGFPAWNFANQPYARRGEYSIFDVNGVLHYRIGQETVKKVDTQEWNSFDHLVMADNGMAYCIAQGPKRSSSLLRVSLKESPPLITVIRYSRDPSSLDQFDISVPRRIEFESGGYTIHANFYPPFNRAYDGIEGSLPPVVIMGHSGPTLPMTQSLDLKKQFLTSRGFAVLDVGYRGTTGKGRDFRRALYGGWGIVDRDDMIEGAKEVVKRGLADEGRLCLMGSSSSGFTLLACMLHSPSIFSAAVSSYGVADLIGLAKDTHKFESGYNEVLLGGPLPEAEAIYKERSPLSHIDKLQTPCAFLHGLEDTVVPVEQSITMYKALKERGVATGILLFENEGHGFRSADAVRESTEAAYYFLCKVNGIEPSVESKLQIVNLNSKV